jgi:hypothetical protein
LKRGDRLDRGRRVRVIDFFLFGFGGVLGDAKYLSHVDLGAHLLKVFAAVPSLYAGGFAAALATRDGAVNTSNTERAVALAARAAAAVARPTQAS